MARILVVDDEPNIREVVGLYLRRDGHAVVEAADGEQALELYGRTSPDLVVLDLMLPKMSGLQVLRHLRAETDIPILILSARVEEQDRIDGLELGADDYVTKPFAVRELVARVRAIMRRVSVPQGQRQDELSYDGLKIHLPSRRVTVGERDVDLTYTEFELLVTLASNPGRVFSRSTLLTRVWGDEFRDERTVDVHIRHLREKIERDPRNPEFIHTARGVGYVFR